MPWTIETALDDPDLTVISRDSDRDQFNVRIGKLKTIVTISLQRSARSVQTGFKVSHAMKTPEQLDPYWTGVPHGDYPAYALRKAITGLTDYYRQGVKAGHEPREDWLVPG